MGANDGCDCEPNTGGVPEPCSADTDCQGYVAKDRPDASQYHNCDPGRAPFGLALDFVPYDQDPDKDINYLGGHQGNLKNNSCTGVTVGDDCPCGCGCNCTDAPPSAPPSSEAMEMRLHRVGYTFDGTGGYQENCLGVES